MVKRLLWKTVKNPKPDNREGDRVRKRKAQELEIESSNVSKSSLRQSNRLRRSTESKKLPYPRQGDDLRRPNKKHRKKKHGMSEASMTFPRHSIQSLQAFMDLKI